MPHMIELLELDNLCLPQNLERKDFVPICIFWIGWADQTNSGKGACINQRLALCTLRGPRIGR